MFTLMFATAIDMFTVNLHQGAVGKLNTDSRQLAIGCFLQMYQTVNVCKQFDDKVQYIFISKQGSFYRSGRICFRRQDVSYKQF